MTHEAGKGSKRRPTDEKKFAENWENIFGKKIKHPVTGETIKYRYSDDKNENEKNKNT